MGEFIVLEEPQKQCRKCKVIQPISNFGKDNKAKDGCQAYCKDCQREVYQKWKAQNKDRYRQLARNYYYKHKKERMQYQRDYRTDKKKLAVHGIRKHNPELQPLASNCLFCGGSDNLVRHHPDYDVPEMYVTCCRQCHWWVRNG